MSDMISRDAAIRALVQAHEETGVKTAQAIRIIRELPAAEPETVRCEDCQWSDRKNRPKADHRRCLNLGRRTPAAWSCADGARTEDNR